MTEEPQPTKAVEVFFSYAHEDEDLRRGLEQHFSFLRREGKTVHWHDGEIKAGEDWRGEIEEHLNSADVILLFVSAAFADSDFCYSVELKRALQRHVAGEAVVVPIRLHPCDWQKAPFARLQALPIGDEAISEWTNIQKALMDEGEARQFVERWIAQEAHDPRAFEGLDQDEIIRAADARPYVLQWVLAQINLATEPRAVLSELIHAEGEVGERVFLRSFNLPQLGDDGRATLLSLSLFSPSASRPALAEVAGFGDDRHRLNEAVKRLAALRLVQTTPGGQRLTVEGLTLSLARARLAKDERASEFRERFVSYFLHFATANAQPRPEDFAALEGERNNLLNAADGGREPLH